MGSPKRNFTRAEDEMILANAKGELSYNKLARELRTGPTTITRRADELGVELRTQPEARNFRNHMPRTDTFDEYGNDNPFSVGKDRLLMRLQEIHSGRFYESLIINRKDRITEIPMTNFESKEPEIGKPSLTQHSLGEAIEKLSRQGYNVQRYGDDSIRVNGKNLSPVDVINIAFHGKTLED
jgi:hypothetical protein